MVVIYFACFALGWVALAISLAAVDGAGAKSLRDALIAVEAFRVELALAVHAMLIALLAWKAQRWFFAHGPLAVILGGAPLLVLLRELWFVPAFVYLIAVLHVWLACRHDSLGQLQATHRHSPRTGAA